MTTASTSEQLGALSDSVLKYMRMHSTSVEMNTQYILDAVTLRNDPSKMVLVSDTKKANGKHIGYRQFVQNQGLHQPDDPKYEAQIGLHFKYVERASLQDPITLINKRYMSSVYKEAMPIFSDDQSLVLLPRLETQFVNGGEQSDIIDVFDCSNDVFWTEEEQEIDALVNQYMGSLVLPHKARSDLVSIRIVNNCYICIVLSTTVMIFDIEVAKDQDEVEIENSEEMLRRVEPTIIVKIGQTDKTYDSVCGVIVNSDDLGDSWTILASSNYSKIHMVRLSDFQNHQDVLESGQETKTLGGKFVESEDGILFSASDQTFSSPIQVTSTADHLQAILQTIDETWVVKLEKDIYGQLKIAKVPYLKGKDFNIFRRDQGAMLFCEKKESDLIVQFSDLEIRESEDFSNTTLNINSLDYEIVDVIEFERDGTQIFRISYIEGSESFNCIEIEASCTGEQYTAQMNSNKLSTLRWPFFAYMNDPWSVVISPLVKSNYYVYFNLMEEIGVSEEMTIQQLEFTNEGSLIILVAGDGQEIYYRLKVKTHFNKDITSNQVIDNMSMVALEDFTNSEGNNFSFFEEICRKDQQESVVQQIIVVEQLLGLESILTVVEHRTCNKLSIIVAQTDGKHSFKETTDVCEYTVKSMSLIDSKNIVVREDDQDVLRLLTIDYNGVEMYQDSILHTETKNEIVKLSCSYRNLYLLLCGNSGSNYSFRSYYLDEVSNQLVATGCIRDVSAVNSSFINEFQRCNTVMENIFIANDIKFVKYYAKVDDEMPTLQNYFNYLPASSKDTRGRKLQVGGLSDCRTSKRILMQFSYPVSRLPKLAIITPYFGTNELCLSKEPIENVITWMANVENTPESQGLAIMNRAASMKQQKLNFSATVGLCWEQPKFNTRIYRFKPETFKLQEFDLTGSQKRSSSFREQFDDKQILAIGSHKLTFLLTPEASMYLEELEIKQITENHVCEQVSQFSTKDIELSSGRSLFDVMYDMVKLSCTFNFYLNDESMQVLIECSTPADYIVGLFLIETETQTAHQIIVDDEQQNLFMQLFGQELTLHNQKPARAHLDLLKAISEKFLLARNCEIDHSQIIVYSKKNIMYGSVEAVENVPKAPIYLEKCKFQLADSSELQDKNSKRIFKRKTKKIEGTQDDDFQEAVQSMKGEVIEDIAARNMAGMDENFVIIKIRQSNRKCFLIYYDLKQDVEFSSLTVSEKSQVFYSADNQVMVCDPELGIMDIRTREILHEYQIPHYNTDELDLFDMTQSNKMLQNNFAKYFLTPSSLLMPYSLLSVVQHHQPIQMDIAADRFYTGDYYKLEGRTTLHKFMEQPLLLNKLIDCYQAENVMFLTTLLVKEVLNFQQSQETMFGTPSINKSESFTKGLHGQSNESLLTEGDAGSAVVLKLTQNLGMDVIDMQIDMSNDEILNKILHYFVQVEQQFTFSLMQPKLAALATYKRFGDYFAASLQQTDQMKSVQVLFTDYEGGKSRRIGSNTSFLGVDFFKDCPQEKPSDNDEVDQMMPFGENDDDFKKVDDSDSIDSRWQDHSMNQVRIYYSEVSWLFTQKHGLEFMQELATNDDCLQLMKLESSREIFNFIWYNCAPYIIMSTFVPYISLIVVPLINMSILIGKIEQHSSSTIEYFVYYFSVFLFFLGVVNFGYKEVEELIKNKPRKYLADSKNYFQIIFMIACVVLLTQIMIGSGFLIFMDREGLIQEKGNIADNQRVKLIIVIQLAVIEFFERVKIFDFFSSFVRQLREIIADSVPLGSMLAFIVLAQALLFWILDQNSSEMAYEGWSGFFLCVIDSYRLAVGDFEIVGSFSETSEYMWLFWVIFFIGTLVSLLIILNMVIALMGATFERVGDDTDAYILRDRIALVCENYELFPKKIQERIRNAQYLVTIQVDPDIDPIEDDSPEKRVTQRIDQLEKSIKKLLAKNGIGGDDEE